MIVYFSTASNNTHRFVEKLDLPAARIPEAVPTQPFVLITPTYSGAVPAPVIRFLNQEANRDLLLGVISSGNLNFGPDFGAAGRTIAAKCGVPHLYQFELTGTPEDVDEVREMILGLCSNTDPSHAHAPAH